MTPVDEAVERVRGYVEAMAGTPASWRIDYACDLDGDDKIHPLELSDLRALLSALELGSVGPSALPVVTADEPATPSADALLESEGYVAADPHDLTDLDYEMLGRACESHGLGWFIADGTMRFQPPSDVIEEAAIDKLMQGAPFAQAALSASTTDSGKGRLDAEARLHAEADAGCEPAGEWRPSKEAVVKIIADHIDFPLGWGAGIPDPLTIKSCAVTRDDIGRAADAIIALPPAPPTGEGGGL